MNNGYNFYRWTCVLLILGRCIGEETAHITKREGMHMNKVYGEGIGTNTKKDKEYYGTPAQNEDDKPIQLIYPSEDHSMLLLNATNMKYLAEIDKPIAVVSVVGPLHSGKSFLMNQLLNRTNGFELGPTTMPKTRGLWMWKNPIKIEKRRDQKEIAKSESHFHRSTNNLNENEYYLLLLDSEGLYASQVNEIYDAKIFAISTLLSSYIIYNSVKFVDQASIDALRLLVKRSHLFELRMELREKVEEEEEEGVYLGWLKESGRHLKMPKLLWVIQDFVQVMEKDQSPKEWLNSMMAINREEDDDDDAKKPFDQVFREIDCYTLFLPQYEKHKLVRLDLIEPYELLEEYKRDMEGLRKKVFEEAPIKEDEEGECDGARLSRWLQRLVLAANKGMFPEVPSMWTSFQRLQKKKAVEDAVQYFEHELRKEVVERKEIGEKRMMNRREMKEVTDQLRKEAKTILERMVYGLIEEEKKEYTVNLNQMPSLDQNSYQSYNTSTDKIESNMTLSQKFDFKINLLIDTYVRLNEYYIAQYCEECYRKKIGHFMEKIEALNLPINLKLLETKRNEWYEEETSNYRELVRVYLEEEETKEKKVCSEYETELGKRIDLEWKNIWEENLQKLDTKLKKELEVLENKERRTLERQIKSKIEEQEKEGSKKGYIVSGEKANSLLPLKNKVDDILEQKDTLSHQLILPFKSRSQSTSISEKHRVLILSQPSKKFLKYSSYHVISPSTLLALFSQSGQEAQAYWKNNIIDPYCLDHSPDFKAQWDSKVSHILNQLFHEFKVQQDELLSLVLDEQFLYFTQWLSNLLDQYIPLPQPKHQLYVYVTSLYDQLIEYYDETFSHLAHLDSVMAKKSKLYLAFKDELAEIERRNERKLDFILSITLPTFKDEIEQTVLSYWIPQDAIHFAKTQMIKKLREREHVVDEQIAHELADRFIQKYLEKSIEHIRNRLILLVGFIVTSFAFILIGIKLNQL
ncbi:guanylate-binding protein 1-like [Schistocerca gregaria]|uniref:guanylate-binding protein 1-like n=1 Tax=Schistocerca gregaria TaxID=7010 RepID=UPI00211F1A7C|nr:guanylate-binding protein 1-like [Schistocerca gregaria]